MEYCDWVKRIQDSIVRHKNDPRFVASLRNAIRLHKMYCDECQKKGATDGQDKSKQEG